MLTGELPLTAYLGVSYPEHFGPDNSILEGDCPVDCRMFSRILGLYSLNKC